MWYMWYIYYYHRPTILVPLALLEFFFENHYSHSGYLVYGDIPHLHTGHESNLHVGCITPEPVSSLG